MIIGSWVQHFYLRIFEWFFGVAVSFVCFSKEFQLDQVAPVALIDGPWTIIPFRSLVLFIQVSHDFGTSKKKQPQQQQQQQKQSFRKGQFREGDSRTQKIHHRHRSSSFVNINPSILMNHLISWSASSSLTCIRVTIDDDGLHFPWRNGGHNLLTAICSIEKQG